MRVPVTLGAFLYIIVATSKATVQVDFVFVGDRGNLNDSTGYGAVAYDYKIGAYEVSLLQYTAFLNAVAATDSYGLWNSEMQSDLNIAGIARSGTSGNYAYSLIGDGHKPVSYVSWFDAARFMNWLHNGQPTGEEGPGTTETGAYTLNGALSGVITKNADALYWIPTEDEWYKAAYYDPSLNGPTDGYWLYPTRSDSRPGNLVGDQPNQANHYIVPGLPTSPGFSVTQTGAYSSTQNYLTPGGAFSASASYYGTFDQAGNVFEMNDSISGSSRGVRGGSWYDFGGDNMDSADRFAPPIDLEDRALGFRIATIPEPAVAGLIGLGTLAIGLRRRIGNLERST